jgi:DNA-binding CsgD family transcriptional regulator
VTHVVVTLAPMLPERERLERHLSFQYNMTGAEIRLAWTVIEGLTPAEAAKTLGITIFTVRTYLKRLYAKTGVHSNAALTRLLLKLASEY